MTAASIFLALRASTTSQTLSNVKIFSLLSLRKSLIDNSEDEPASTPTFAFLRSAALLTSAKAEPAINTTNKIRANLAIFFMIN